MVKMLSLKENLKNEIGNKKKNRTVTSKRIS